MWTEVGCLSSCYDQWSCSLRFVDALCITFLKERNWDRIPKLRLIVVIFAICYFWLEATNSGIQVKMGILFRQELRSLMDSSQSKCTKYQWMFIKSQHECQDQYESKAWMSISIWIISYHLTIYFQLWLQHDDLTTNDQHMFGWPGTTASKTTSPKARDYQRWETQHICFPVRAAMWKSLEIMLHRRLKSYFIGSVSRYMWP